MFCLFFFFFLLETFCYCYQGIVKENNHSMLVTVEKARESERAKAGGKPKTNEHRQSGPLLNVVGSVIFSAANSSCSISTDWGGFPQQLFSPYPGYFSIRDQAKCGDWFLVYDNNTLLGATSNVSSAACLADAALPVPLCRTNLDSPCRSRGCFYLAPNVQHNINVVVGFSPFGANIVGADVAYYAAAPGADCSQSQLTGDNLSLNFCTPTPPNVGPSPCSPFGTLPTPQGCPTFFTE